MGFRTKLDFSNNRQVKQYEKKITVLSGGTSFGITYSGLTSGPDLSTTGISESITSIASTFSGNSGTTNYNWFDSRMILGQTALSAITPSTSASTQETGTILTVNSSTTIDGNFVALSYSGVSFDLSVIAMYDLGGGSYSGTVITTTLDILSASTLDYTGRTIWNDVHGISRTEKLIITNNPQIGHVWTCIDSEGMGGWQPSSGSTSGTSLWTAGTGYISVVMANSDGDASGPIALVEGYGTVASGSTSHAEGYTTIAGGDYSHSEGIDTKAFGYASHAEGDNTIANGSRSHAEGLGSQALVSYCHAEGNYTTASGNNSHSEGYQTVASGSSSHAEGDRTISGNEGTHSEGSQTQAYGTQAHAEGWNTTALGNQSHSEGTYTIASGTTSHAEGSSTTAGGDSSHTEGDLTTTTGYASHAEGALTIASGYASHAEGLSNEASGNNSHAEGNVTIASGNSSHAEGSHTEAIGIASHSEGLETIASGYTSHAEGYLTTASGLVSHSQGQQTTASGNFSHAGGAQVIASGDYSFVHGQNSLASNNNTIVFGQNMTGTSANTVYVPNLNVKSIGSGTKATNLAIDNIGNIISGTTGDIFYVSKSPEAIPFVAASPTSKGIPAGQTLTGFTATKFNNITTTSTPFGTFNNTTGVFTVSTGCTLLIQAFIHLKTDSSATNYWSTTSTGQVGMGICVDNPTDFYCGDYQVILQNITNAVDISTSTIVYATAGTTFKIKVLNQTDRNYAGYPTITGDVAKMSFTRLD